MKTSMYSEKIQDYLSIAKAALYILGIIAAVYMLFKVIPDFLWLCYYAGIPM